jgi:chitinase
VYAFATLKDHKLSEANDNDPDMYDQVLELREKNPELQVLLAIGGWAFGSTPFKELTSNVFRMNQFVYEAIEFLREYQFNGLDVDWEYPRGADDRKAYVDLLRELRVAFEGEAKNSGQPRLLLTAAVPASFEAIAAGYDVPEISKYLDFINVMTYDFHGQWERQVGHNSPLFPLESASGHQKKLTVDYSAREWVKQGAPKEKLLIGMPTYGRSFTLVNETQFDIGAAASGGGAVGKFTNEAGFLSYYEVCSFLSQSNTTLVWDSEQQVPFAYRKDQWVGFDDERSLKTKVRSKKCSIGLQVVTARLVSDGVVEGKRIWRHYGVVS